MKVLPNLALVLSLAYPVRAQRRWRSVPPLRGDIAAGETRSYTFTADAGDEIAGPAELLGPEGPLQFLDGVGNRVAGTRITGHLGALQVDASGFVAPASGTYQVRITAAGTRGRQIHAAAGEARGSARMRGVICHPEGGPSQANAFDNSPVTCSRAEVMR